MPFDPRTYTRQISTAAYRAALGTGFISAKRRIVYDYVWQHAPCCQAEAVRDLSAGNTNDGVITTRFSELADMEAIEIVGRAASPVNPRQIVGFYDITGRAKALPKKPQMYMLWSDSSPYTGMTSYSESDLIPNLKAWLKSGYADARIFKISVRTKR